MRIGIALFFSFRLEGKIGLERIVNAVRVSAVSLHSQGMQ